MYLLAIESDGTLVLTKDYDNDDCVPRSAAISHT
jgi:hypothetical protein